MASRASGACDADGRRVDCPYACDVRDVVLEGHGLHVDDVVAVARHGATLRFGEEGRSRILASHRALARALGRGVPVYGATRALGAKSGVTVDEVAPFQTRIVRGRSVALGAALPKEVVRALLTARAAGLAVGGSGVSPAAADALVGLLAADPPPVPSVGSVGATDLTVVAHAVAPVLDLVALGPKDGLALISGNALSTGWGALVVHDARVLLGWAEAAAALSVEGYAANLAPLDERAQAARPAAGQADAAARLRTLLAGTSLADAPPQRLQDALSFRCLSPVLGAARAALDAAITAVEVELNGAGDNPLVLADDEEVLHVGNAHAAGLSLAFDALGLALHGVASLAAGRVAHLLDTRSSGLPRGLTPRGGDRAGLVPVQKTVAALVAGVAHLAMPTPLAATALSEGVEDHASFAPLAVEHLADMLERLRALVACELVVAAQAHDLRGTGGLGVGTARAYAVVREHVPTLDDDRPLGAEIEGLAARLGEP